VPSHLKIVWNTQQAIPVKICVVGSSDKTNRHVVIM
jgi:hypothetical protein